MNFQECRIPWWVPYYSVLRKSIWASAALSFLFLDAICIIFHVLASLRQVFLTSLALFSLSPPSLATTAPAEVSHAPAPSIFISPAPALSASSTPPASSSAAPLSFSTSQASSSRTLLVWSPRLLLAFPKFYWLSGSPNPLGFEVRSLKNRSISCCTWVQFWAGPKIPELRSTLKCFWFFGWHRTPTTPETRLRSQSPWGPLWSWRDPGLLSSWSKSFTGASHSYTYSNFSGHRWQQYTKSSRRR